MYIFSFHPTLVVVKSLPFSYRCVLVNGYLFRATISPQNLLKSSLFLYHQYVETFYSKSTRNLIVKRLLRYIIVDRIVDLNVDKPFSTTIRWRLLQHGSWSRYLQKQHLHKLENFNKSSIGGMS